MFALLGMAGVSAARPVRPVTVRQSAGMPTDDRFDTLIASLGGFYRSWLVHLGLELGFFRELRGQRAGLTTAELAARTGTDPAAVDVWAWAADAHDLADLDEDRLRIDEDLAAILLDEQAADYLGGQISHAVVASMDWSGMAEFFRTGRPIAERPDRYRASIAHLTSQDIAIFFQEVLAELPQLVASLVGGGRILDVHCGGGRWLVAMARRFPKLTGVGVEFEPDSVARARAHVAAHGLTERIAIEQGDVTSPGHAGEFDLAYFQYALHQLAEAGASLRAAWEALRPGGRLIVLDWPLPSSVDEFRTRHGELIAGVQLDEVFQGTQLATREQFLDWFADVGLAPLVIDLPSGASAFVAERPA